MQEARSFTAPPTDVTIWRFMDFTAFVAVLEHSGLFFVRPDKLGDPFEASVPKPTFDARRDIFLRASGEVIAADELLKTLAQFCQLNCRLMKVSCWHTNEDESAAMWTLYGSNPNVLGVRDEFRNWIVRAA